MWKQSLALLLLLCICVQSAMLGSEERHKVQKTLKEFAKARGDPTPMCPTYPRKVDPTRFIAHMPKKLSDFLQWLGPTLDLAYEGKGPLKDMTSLVKERNVGIQFVYRNQVFYSYNYGSSQSGNASSHTPYRVGSITKAVTVLTLMQMASQGKLQLSDKISSFNPDFHPGSDSIDSDGGKITWAQLASQISGLALSIPCDYVSLENVILHDACKISLTEALKRFEEPEFMIHHPNEIPAYSDGAYALLGRLLEPLFGMKYEDYVQKHIFEPLGMKDSFFTYTNSASPPAHQGNTSIPSYVAHAPLNWANPTGQLYSSTHDLSQLVKVWLEPENNKLGIEPSVLRTMLSPSYINDDGCSGYGYPMELIHTNFLPMTTKYPGWFYGKSGAIPGYSATAAMQPKLSLGVIVATNNMDSGTAAYALLAILNGVVGDALYEIAEPFPNPGNLTAFQGTYSASLLTIPLSIEVSVLPDHRLFVNGSLGEFYATWTQGNVFRLHPTKEEPCLQLETGLNEEYVKFVLNSITGNVYGLQVRQMDPLYGTTFVKSWF